MFLLRLLARLFLGIRKLFIIVFILIVVYFVGNYSACYFLEKNIQENTGLDVSISSIDYLSIFTGKVVIKGINVFEENSNSMFFKTKNFSLSSISITPEISTLFNSKERIIKNITFDKLTFYSINHKNGSNNLIDMFLAIDKHSKAKNTYWYKIKTLDVKNIKCNFISSSGVNHKSEIEDIHMKDITGDESISSLALYVAQTAFNNSYKSIQGSLGLAGTVLNIGSSLFDSTQGILNSVNDTVNTFKK